jgi:hypothetical protein
MQKIRIFIGFLAITCILYILDSKFKAHEWPTVVEPMIVMFSFTYFFFLNDGWKSYQSKQCEHIKISDIIIKNPFSVKNQKPTLTVVDFCFIHDIGGVVLCYLKVVLSLVIIIYFIYLLFAVDKE